ncbi:hypothetical protein D3C72_2462230 [compost metagenome]
MTALVVRAYESLHHTKLPVEGAPGFKDVQKGWASDYIQAAAAFKLVNGVKENWFGMGQNATRAESAQLIYNYLQR